MSNEQNKMKFWPFYKPEDQAPSWAKKVPASYSTSTYAVKDRFIKSQQLEIENLQTRLKMTEKVNAQLHDEIDQLNRKNEILKSQFNFDLANWKGNIYGVESQKILKLKYYYEVHSGRKVESL